MSSTNLISASELLGGLDDPHLRIIDARFELTDPRHGAAAYASGHVPGAQHLDLDEDLSGAPGKHGGRHPLPDAHELAAKLGAAGIGRQHRVVVYDQAGAMYAARAWWLLRFLGHDDVRFLDGGMDAYLEAGGELSREAPRFPPTAFEPSVRSEMLVDAEHVKRVMREPGVIIMDARAGERYRGEVEPLDPKAGHIPGAINLYYQDALEGGRFKTGESLARFTAPAHGASQAIAYCGSGVSGAHLILALHESGVTDAKLYAGSWSDWSSYDELPVATGIEESNASSPSSA